MKISREKFLERWEEIPIELKEVLYDDSFDSAVLSFLDVEQLSDDLFWDIQDVTKGVLFGFIEPKKSYEFLNEKIGEAGKALRAYQLLNDHIFSKWKSLIQNVYEKYASLNIATPISIEEPKLEERVNLKKSPLEQVQAVNLKTEPIEKIPSSPGPVIIKVANQQENQKPHQATPFSQPSAPFTPVSRGELFSPHTFHTRYDVPSQKQEAPAQAVQMDEKKNEQASPTTDAGPVILHQKEDSIPVAQMAKFKEYKNASPGGFLGSFGSLFSRKQDMVQTPRASVEMPPPVSIPNSIPQKEDIAQDVAVRVKDFDKKQTPPLRYKDYRAYLDSRDKT